MSFSRFYARRIIFGSKLAINRLGVVLATLSVALGLAVMEISLGVVNGFEKAIEGKIIGFVGAIEIGKYLPQIDEERTPIALDASWQASVLALPEVAGLDGHIQLSSLMQGPEDIDGVLLLGVDGGYQNAFFEEAFTAGTWPNWAADSNFSRKVIASERLIKRLQLDEKTIARLYFLDSERGRTRARPAQIATRYSTGFVEWDNNFVLCDARMLRGILGWPEGSYERFHVQLAKPLSPAELEGLKQQINRLLPPELVAQSVYDRQSILFDWLRLQSKQVDYILGLMIIVAIVNLVSATLLLVTEQRQSIGLLKALGSPPGQVQRIFVWQAFGLLLVGILLGNLIGLGGLALQESTGLIGLDPEAYFVDTVPVAWDVSAILQVNGLMLLICTLCLWLPSRVVQRVQPATAIRW